MNQNDLLQLHAFNAAVSLIEAYVKRGDSYEYLKAGQLGCSCRDFSAAIGGYVDRVFYPSSIIIVTRANGLDITPQTFPLKTIFDHIKNKGETVIQQTLF